MSRDSCATENGICGPEASAPPTTEELLRNADSQAPPQTYRSPLAGALLPLRALDSSQPAPRVRTLLSGFVQGQGDTKLEI